MHMAVRPMRIWGPRTWPAAVHRNTASKCGGHARSIILSHIHFDHMYCRLWMEQGTSTTQMVSCEKKKNGFKQTIALAIARCAWLSLRTFVAAIQRQG